MDEVILDLQVKQAQQYLLKKGNAGLEVWLQSKGFPKEERNYIRINLGFEEEED